MTSRNWNGLFIAAGLLLASSAFADKQHEGGSVFTDNGDVGLVRTPGAVDYDGNRQDYEISASGTNIWADNDEFHFVWRRIDGDFLLSADAAFLGAGVDPHRKLGLMVRSSLDPDSAYVDAVLHGDGLTSMQYRPAAGQQTQQQVAAVDHADVLQLERRGDRYFVSVARKGEPLRTLELDDINLPTSAYVGLFVCAHNADVVERARFSNVRLTRRVPTDFRPYQDYFGSRLEVMDVATGHRRVLHTENDSLQAPNWTRDGKALIYNRNGLLYRYELDNGKITAIDTGFATRNNNDHAISFDGAQLAISHHDSEFDNQSMVYTLPIGGGTPTRVTKQAPSYFHSWSPDGRWLTYTGGRDGNYDIYVTRSDGSGDELRLTTDTALDDGSEYSPDGRYIYFNSARSGKMQIWRMRADGSEQEQVTDDEYNNWFPHLSPDGSQIVYLAYMPDVAAAEHPWYQPVYLVSRSLDNGKSRIIANLYGGQGTINVPSWSPDGRYIAFVSNTAEHFDNSDK